MHRAASNHRVITRWMLSCVFGFALIVSAHARQAELEATDVDEAEAAQAPSETVPPRPAEPEPGAPLARNDDLAFVRRRGVELYERHQASLLALDAAQEVGLDENAPDGWITVQEGSGYRVRFIAQCEEGPCSVIDVFIDNDRLNAQALYPPAILKDEQALAWRAKELVFATQTVMCDTPYNAVVLPPQEDGEEWTVYLIAQPDEADVVAVGGHVRVFLDPVSDTVYRAEDLSTSCLLTRRNPDQPSIGLAYAQSPMPAETHVFTSLLDQVVFYVGTGAGVFLVNGDEVRLMSEQEQAGM